MCGLTGVARVGARGGDPAQVKAIFTELLDETKARGRHATGIAAHGGRSTFVWKRAAPANVVVKSDAYEKVMKQVSKRFQILMGHTRFATHDNADRDDCAHPFKYGPVIGAHNGMITNWWEVQQKLDVKCKVDSEVVFAGLATHDDPQETLDLLDGYWALTWMRNGQLFVCRSGEAPLSMAYVSEWQCLFWNSEDHVLKRVLNKHKVPAYELWSPLPGHLYTFSPWKFDAAKTHVVKRGVTFKSRRRDHGKVDTARPPMWRGGYSVSTGSSVASFEGWHEDETIEQWRERREREREAADLKASKSVVPFRDRRSAARMRPRLESSKGTGHVSLIEMKEELDEAYVKLAEVEANVAYLEDQLETLLAERDFIFKVLDDTGLLNIAAQAEMAREERKSQVEMALDSTPTGCKVCGGDEGRMLVTPTGWIHEECVLMDDSVKTGA